MDFPEGSNMGAPGEPKFPLELFLSSDVPFQLEFRRLNRGKGRFCGRDTTFSKLCGDETDMAGHRLLHRLSWKRRIDTCKANATGIVNHPEYCAPRGTIVHIDDAPMCCSKVTRTFNPQDAGDQALARAQRVIFDPPGEKAYVPVVCTQP